MKPLYQVESDWRDFGLTARAAKAAATLMCETPSDVRAMGRNNFEKLEGIGSAVLKELEYKCQMMK